MVVFLLLSILFSTLTVSFFKIFEIKKVQTFQAIVMNYLSCGVIGNILSEKTVFQIQVWNTDWYIYTLILGSLFISILFCIGLTAQKMGVSVSMVAAKLSVVIPVLVAVFLHHEMPGIIGVIGIVVSMIAVLIMSRSNEEQATSANLWILPLLVFVGSGFIDSILHYLEEMFIPAYSADTIVTTVFLNAFLLGSIILIGGIITGKTKLDLNSILWGLLLGLPNYFSMFFLVKTLQGSNATIIFPINNIGIVLASTLFSVLFFKEILTKNKWIGLSLALLAIALMSI
jgi:drug/metabolite transporter (DMT)-like permease